MDERVGWFLVPNCSGIYPLIWVQGEWGGMGGGQEAGDEKML